MNESLEALREYVTAPGSQNQAETTVRMLVTHSSLKARFMEIRLDKHVRLNDGLDGARVKWLDLGIADEEV